MKNILTLLVTILLANLFVGQNQKEKSEFFVINILGAKVYEKPTFNSESNTKLAFGETLVIEEVLETNEKFQIGSGFSLAGKWIKPKGLRGFVFSSDLTHKNVETGKNAYGQPYLDLLGKLIKEESEEKLIKTEMGEFPKIFVYKYFENGTYTYSAWDGCFDHVWNYKNLELNEVYHQMVSDYGVLLNGKEFTIPEFYEVSESTIKFEGEGPTEDLSIEIGQNGLFVVSSYDCD